MGNFARALHHLDMKDVKRERLEKIAAQKLKEKKDREEKKIIQEISKKYKSDWKREIYEGMTTANAQTITVAPAEGDGTVTAVDVIDASSYSGTVTGMLGADAKSGNTGSVIRDSGSGTGSDGGFNVGGKYLSFQGDGYNVTGHAIRWAALSPIDSSRINSLTITAIVGNDSNGGEDPDASAEDLRVMYKTPSMDTFRLILFNPSGEVEGDINSDIIIPLGASGNSGLNNYSVKIPEYAREKDTQFALIQLVSSGTGFDNYGITNIKFQRTTPVNVVVPLDDPEAISFVRVGSDEGDPKKRKKKLNDQLAASDEYTQAQLGDDFPGRGARVGGDDPFASAKIGDDVKPSPIGKAEVKKSFSDFSADSATSDPEPTEPEPTAPSSQTTMAPTNDDGDPIPVKPVGGKNSGVVQGADAANIDAQEPEPEPEVTEPEVTEPEAIEPESPDETKTPEEVEEIENEKYNAKADESANVIDNLIDFKLDQGIKSLNAIAQVTGVVINTAVNIGAFAANVLGMKEANGFVSMIGKIQNSIDIARSVLSGKITNANILPQEIKTFADSMKLDEFQAKKIFISDVRHEYADDNIYVKDGKVYQNGDGKNKKGLYATPLANQGFKGVDVHGSGYAQMIIPKDGSEPYLHYYDHNYENLNNASDVNPTGGIVQSIDEIWSNLFGPEDLVLPNGKVVKGLGKANTVDIVAAGFKSISHVIHQLKSDNTKFLPTRLKDSMITYFSSFDQVYEGLLKTSSLEGFPPGIHGSALTDFKVPLSKLPQETQEMIAKHPLSWTPERIENMSDEQINEQLYPLLTTNEQFENYRDFTSDITKMSTEPVNTVPYAVAMQEIDEVFEQYENDLLQKYGEDGWEEFTKSDQFFATQTAALEDLETLEIEERKELDENNSIRGVEVSLDLWDQMVKPAYDAFVKATTGGSLSGDSPITKRLQKQHAKWKKKTDKMEEDHQRIQSEIMERYREQRKPINNIAYNQLTTLREPVDDSPFGEARWKVVNRDGDESSGADYTALDGTVYTGRNTYYDDYYNTQEQTYTQINALYDPVADLRKFVDGAYVRENIGGQFEDEFGFSSDNWSPEKKGDGVSKGDDPFVDPFANEIKPNLGAKPGDELAMADGVNYDLYNWYVKTYGAGAGGWYMNNPNSNPKNNPFLPGGAYVPKADASDSNLGSVASVGGVDATAAATAAASQGGRRKKKNKNNIMVAHYQPTSNDLLEKYARPQPKNDLFERLKQKQFFNPKDIKPVFPENPPPQLDPKTGMHPNYGKNAKRFRKLDPISANAMPPTGDPETDAVVDKQRTKPKTFAKFKKKLKENFTVVPSGPTNSATQTFQHASGQNFSFSGLGGQEAHPSTLTVFGDTVPAPNYNQLAIAGYAKPIVMQKKNLENVNPKLDASQEFAQKVGADVMMNARVDDELDKLKEILDQKTKKLSDIQRRIDELNKLAAQQSKKISKMRDDGLKKIDAKYDERQKVRDRMVRKFEASFPSLRYTISGAMQITDKADSDRYHKTEGDFYKKVDATWDAMTKKIDAERKAFLEKMDKLYNSTVGKYNQEEFNLTQYELPTAKAQYDEALKNHSNKLLDKNQLNQEQNMLQGMIDEVTSMFANLYRNNLGGLPLPVEMTLRYAMGNMDPLTKSPGILFNRFTMKAIVNAYKTGSMSVIDKDYGGMDEQIARAMLNKFNYQITPNGIRVMDTFNFDDPDTGGANIGAFSVIPGAQWLATQLVKAGDRNARSKGIDPRDPRFGIKVDYTIPKSQLTPDQIKLFYGKSKATDRTGYGYDTKGKLDSSGYGMDPNRDTETEARPIKTSKTVQKIKSMSKERMARKALSLDQPVVRSSKKSKKKRG